MDWLKAQSKEFLTGKREVLLLNSITDPVKQYHQDLAEEIAKYKRNQKNA